MKTITYQHLDREDINIEDLQNYDKKTDEEPKEDWASVSAVMLAKQGNEILGVIAWRPYTEDDGSEWAYLTDVSVLPLHRGKGIAKQMLYQLITLIKHRKIWRFFLHVRTHNTAAIQLYIKMGFIVEDTIPKYFEKDEDSSLDNDDDAHLMTRISRHIQKKQTRFPSLRNLEQTSEEVEYRKRTFLICAWNHFHGAYWGWRILINDYTTVAGNEYEEKYTCANDAFRAAKKYFDNHKEDVEKEADDRLERDAVQKQKNLEKRIERDAIQEQKLLESFEN